MPKSRPATVHSLAEARVARRLATYAERLDKVLRSNRRSIGRLYTTGRLFTKSGLRAGRDLLHAHEHLLRVVSLIEVLGNEGEIPPPKSAKETEAIFAELDTLLERTRGLTEHTSKVLDELKRE